MSEGVDEKLQHERACDHEVNYFEDVCIPGALLWHHLGFSDVKDESSNDEEGHSELKGVRFVHHPRPRAQHLKLTVAILLAECAPPDSLPP